eukprot:jgi/Chlat1/1483/Chrsp12S02021
MSTPAATMAAAASVPVALARQAVIAKRVDSSAAGFCGSTVLLRPRKPSIVRMPHSQQVLAIRTPPQQSYTSGWSFQNDGFREYCEDKRKLPELTSADRARSIAEASSQGVLICAVVIDRELPVGMDMPYVVEESGDILVRIPADQAILRNLAADPNCMLMVGFGSCDDVVLQQVVNLVEAVEVEVEIEGVVDLDDHNYHYQNYSGVVLGDDDDSDQDDEDEDDEDEDGQFASTDDMIAANWEVAQAETSAAEASGYDVDYNTWTDLATLALLHPLEFSCGVARAATAEYAKDLDTPVWRVTLAGQISPIPVHQKAAAAAAWHRHFPADKDMRKAVAEDQTYFDVVRSNGFVQKRSATDEFYRLRPVNVRLDTASGEQVDLTGDEFAMGMADALARESDAIVQAFNTKNRHLKALQTLCRQKFAKDPEEARICRVDTLGFDIRICENGQMHTLRCPFPRKVRSRMEAEKWLAAAVNGPTKRREF